MKKRFVSTNLGIKAVGMIMLCAFLQSPSALASGSEGFGGASTGAAQMYNTGKKVYVRQVVCKDCVLAGKKLNKESAADLLAGRGDDAAKITSMLTTEEQAALAVYLKRRYKL